MHFTLGSISGNCHINLISSMNDLELIFNPCVYSTVFVLNIQSFENFNFRLIFVKRLSVLSLFLTLNSEGFLRELWNTAQNTFLADFATSYFFNIANIMKRDEMMLNSFITPAGGKKYFELFLNFFTSHFVYWTFLVSAGSHIFLLNTLIDGLI